MSITIHQQPPQITPAYNPVVYLVSSSNTSQPNFRYVFDIYPSPSGTTSAVRVRLPARPSDSRCAFDISRILQSYLGYVLGTPGEATAFNVASSVIYAYQVNIGEEYGTTPVVHADLSVVTAKYVFHGGLDYLDFPSYAMNDHILRRTVPGGHFLSNMPLTQDIEITHNAWLYMMVSPTGASSAVGSVEIKKYSDSGLLATLSVNNLWAQSYGMFVLPVGPANINALSGGWIDSGVSYYTVQILDDLGNAVSDLIRYNLTDNCRYETVRLHFLNRKGGMDAFNFTLISRSMTDIKRDSYKKAVGSTSGTSWGYLRSDRGTTVFNTVEQPKGRCGSDWLSEAESVWLEELVSSPEVYREADGALIPVQVSNPSYEEKTKAVEPLFRLEVDFEYSYNNIRQRG